MPVDYVAGNHDPWHLDYFEQELGIRVSADALVQPMLGVNVHVAHGDGLSSRGRLARRLLRNRLPVWMYRNLLPGDTGIRLAKTYLGLFFDDDIDTDNVQRQRDAAKRILRSGNVDLVVMGHSHVAERTRFADGTYLNTGCWYTDRTFGVLNQDGPAIYIWENNAATPYVETQADTRFDEPD
jgi:UDP-2,3-diacylglucosamine hydrolase